MIGLSAILIAAMVGAGSAAAATGPGVVLEDLTWIEAEKVLTPDAVVVIPLGAESKEHGPHLRLEERLRHGPVPDASAFASAPKSSSLRP